MEFHVTPAQRDLQHRARCLAADFATRAAQHDREASDPVENYAALRDAGFYGLNVPAELGNAEYSFATRATAPGVPRG